MDIRLQFLGAAGNVTGSCFLVQAGERRILVDCGLYQERQHLSRNWAPFPIPSHSLDAVLLTHAHLDHSGLLPRLVRDGFRGPIYCTPATAELTRIMLLDSAHIQEEDAATKRRRHQAEGREGPHGDQPLYTVADAERSLQRLAAAPYLEPVPLADGVEATFHEAGHILGSTSIRLTFRDRGRKRSILFSGDIGRWGKPILEDPAPGPGADYVVMESTYADRAHEDSARIDEMLEEAINATERAGGNIVIPSFAVGRAQEVLYHLNRLLRENRIPHLMTFVDSPMAVRVTEVFRRHPELFDREMQQAVNERESLFGLPGLHMVSSTAESKAINHLRGTSIIIAGSGMCTGGRIKHHLVHNIERPESTVLFVGYQAAGTLGRQIVDGSRAVRILGRSWQVKARIVQVQGFSAHADQAELLRWTAGFRQPPRGYFVVHGEPRSAGELARLLRERYPARVEVPEYGQEHSLS